MPRSFSGISPRVKNIIWLYLTERGLIHSNFGGLYALTQLPQHTRYLENKDQSSKGSVRTYSTAQTLMPPTQREPPQTSHKPRRWRRTESCHARYYLREHPLVAREAPPPPHTAVMCHRSVSNSLEVNHSG